MCEKGSYCPGGSAFTLNDTKPQGIFDCASVGTGNYNLSDAGASSADECYADCIASCNAVSAGVCPENSFDCLDVSNTVDGSRFYGQASCTASEFCSYTFNCKDGYIPNLYGGNEIIEYGSRTTHGGKHYSATDQASCDPGVFVVELDPNGGVGGTSNIWQKYTVGWFSDEAATKSLSTIQIPTRENYRFLGYFLDGTEVIDMDGIVNPGASNLFTSNGGVITAQWERLQTECKAGKDVDDSVCQPGYYCPGGWVDAGTEYDKNIGCMRMCPTDRIGGNVSSAEYSDDITDCYAVLSPRSTFERTA